MAFSKFSKNMDVVSALDDEPNDVGGLTAAELKAKFDEGGLALKEFINETLTVEADTHLKDAENPHSVTKEQVGLGSVENTADAEKPVSTAQLEALSQKANREDVLEKGNTTDYTPTEHYHPTTKKYVDTLAAGVVLGQIPDNTLSEEKLNAAVREKLNAEKEPLPHKASHTTGGADALTPGDIGACGAPVMVTVVLPTASWVLNSATTCYEQTVAVAGILATDNQATVHLEPVGSTDAAAQLLTDEAYGLFAGSGGYAACNADGMLYCRCPKGGGKPAVNFSLNVCVGR